MNITYRTFAICCLSVGLLTACSSSDDDSDSTSAPDDVGAKYQGSYAIACTPEGTSGASTSTLDIAGLTASVTNTEYSDAQCVTPTDTIALTVDVSFPGGTQTTERGVADNIDTLITAATINGEVQDLSEEDASDLMEFDIIVLEGSNLFFGDTDDDGVGDSPDTRPTTLDTVPYVRQ